MGRRGFPPTDPNTRKLTPQQEQFVDAYLVHLNATKAAIECGYSKDTAKQAAYQLLAKPYIAKAVQARFDERKLEYAGRVQRLMDEAYQIATSPTARASDKLKAIELSGKFLGIGFDKVQHTHYNGGDAPGHMITIDATPAEATEAYNNLLN